MLPTVTVQLTQAWNSRRLLHVLSLLTTVSLAGGCLLSLSDQSLHVRLGAVGLRANGRPVNLHVGVDARRRRRRRRHRRRRWRRQRPRWHTAHAAVLLGPSELAPDSPLVPGHDLAVGAVALRGVGQACDSGRITPVGRVHAGGQLIIAPKSMHRVHTPSPGRRRRWRWKRRWRRQWWRR